MGKLVKKFRGKKLPTKSGPVAKASTNETKLSAKDQILLDEILKLGGTRQDFELVHGVDCEVNDDDCEQKAENDMVAVELAPKKKQEDDEKLALELKSFMAGLGMDQQSLAMQFLSGADGDSDDDNVVSDEDAIEEQELVVESHQNQAKNLIQKDSIEESNEIENRMPSGKMLVAPESRWYEHPMPNVDALMALLPQPPVDQNTNGKRKKKQAKRVPVTPSLSVQERQRRIQLLHEFTKCLYTRETKLYRAFKNQKSPTDQQWFQTVLKSGTLSDKISALSLSVMESSVHALDGVTTLMGMAQKRGRREAVMAVDALCDLMLGSDEGDGDGRSGLMPGFRKLLGFAEQPLVQAIVDRASEFDWNKLQQYTQNENLAAKSGLKWDTIEMRQALILMHVEDIVKARFYEIVVLLDHYAKDPVFHIKSKMVTHAWSLLQAKREQERPLLSFLVNKLGDIEKKLASKVAYLLQQLLIKHPAMKWVIVKEVEMFLNRPGNSDRAHYYAMVFLNQIILSDRPVDVLTARYLVNLYFNYFQQLIEADKVKNAGASTKEKQPKQKAKSAAEEATSIDSKLMPAILTGINRSFPFAAVSLAGQDRDSVPVDESLKKLWEEESLNSMLEQHTATLFRLTHLQSVALSTSVQSLHLIFLIIYRPQVAKKPSKPGNNDSKNSNQKMEIVNPQLARRYYRALYSLLWDLRITQTSRAHALLLNLIFKSLLQCRDAPTFMAIIRRVVQLGEFGVGQCVPGGGAAWEAASLMVISEVLKGKRENEPALVRLCENWLKGQKNTKIQSADEPKGDNGGGGLFSDDDEEHFVDAPETDDERETKTSENTMPSKDTLSKSESHADYDPFHRSPEYARSDHSAPWELTALTQHFHPTVSLFAETLLYQSNQDGQESSNEIRYPSDPLQDFTLAHFLDRFVFKNPKQISQQQQSNTTSNGKAVKGQHGGSIMQPKPFVSTVLRQSIPMDRSLDNAVTSKQWRQKAGLDSEQSLTSESAATKVPVDEQFYLSYFQQKEQGQKKPTAAKQKQQAHDDVFADEDDIDLDMGGDSDGSMDDQEEVLDVDDLAELSDADSLDEDEIHQAIMNSAPDEIKEGFKDGDSDHDSEDDEEFARMMAEDDDEDEDEALDEELEGSEDGDEALLRLGEESSQSLSDEDESLQEFSQDDDESDASDDMSDISFGMNDSDDDSADSDTDKAKQKAAKKQAKQTIHDRLHSKSSSNKKSRVDMNAVMRQVVQSSTTSAPSSGKKKANNKDAPVFASMDDFEHLIQQDPSFDDPIWKQERVQPGTEDPKHGRKRPRPSSNHKSKKQARRH